MEIVNIEAGTFREMTTSIRLLKEKLENLKSRQTSKSLDDWMDNQEVCIEDRRLKKERKDNPSKSEANPYKQTTLHYVKGYTSLCVVKYSLF